LAVIQRLSRTLSLFKDFRGLENLEKFKEWQEPCKLAPTNTVDMHTTMLDSKTKIACLVFTGNLVVPCLANTE